ncbi:MAG: BNR-4 repeat-containing protein, partial [Tepidisphaeraceae bacterium]
MKRLNVGAASCVVLIGSVVHAANDTAAPLTTYKQNGGWCWFQDPRVIYTNGQLVIGSIAGTTAAGSNGGDANATTYTLADGSSSTFVLHAGLNQDDHAAPAFSVLPDGRVLATYESHGGSNFVYWRTTTSSASANTWSAETTSTVNITNDGNGNTYNNPYYLSVPNKVYDFSRAIGYDPNYSVFTPSSTAGAAPTFSYGGHFLYWKNPNLSGQGPNGGNGRPYVRYTSNGTDTIWFCTTEDSPDNYWNSLYSGYIKFNAAGQGTVYTSTGTAMGALSTGSAPTTGTTNQGAVASGTGFSFNPTQFTPVFKAATDGSLTASWASDMRLDAQGNPYLVMTARANNPSDSSTPLNTMRYYYSHFDGTTWKTSFLAYGGDRLYAGQNNYAGLAAADPSSPN